MPAIDKTPRQQTRSQQTNGISAAGATAVADALNEVVADLFLKVGAQSRRGGASPPPGSRPG